MNGQLKQLFRQQAAITHLSEATCINPLNADLNPIRHLLALLAHHILHVSRIRVNSKYHDLYT